MSDAAKFHVDELPTHENPPLQRVLFPTDGSVATIEAFRPVAPLFGCCRATIHALHVRRGGAITRDRLRYDPDEAAGRTLESFTEDLQALGFDTRSHLARGEPGEEIAKVATDEDVDMIVMPTKTTNAFLNRSVTQSVIASVDIPVLALRP